MESGVIRPLYVHFPNVATLSKSLELLCLISPLRMVMDPDLLGHQGPGSDTNGPGSDFSGFPAMEHSFVKKNPLKPFDTWG